MTTTDMGAEPLAVWDARDDSSLFWLHWQETHRWAMAHLGPEMACRTYSAEFYLVDAPFAVLYCFKENGDGRRYQDPATDEPALADPVIQLLDELPPAHLRGK